MTLVNECPLSHASLNLRMTSVSQSTLYLSFSLRVRPCFRVSTNLVLVVLVGWENVKLTCLNYDAFVSADLKSTNGGLTFWRCHIADFTENFNRLLSSSLLLT